MRIIRPDDQKGDLAFQHRVFDHPVGVIDGAPVVGVSTAAGSRATYSPDKRPPFARDAAPTNAKEAFRWLRKIEEYHPDGVAFYHPGLGSNVVGSRDATGRRVFTRLSSVPADEAAWFASGCVGTAPNLDPSAPVVEPTPKKRSARSRSRSAKPTAKVAAAKHAPEVEAAQRAEEKVGAHVSSSGPDAPGPVRKETD